VAAAYWRVPQRHHPTNVIQEHALPVGLMDVKVASIDDNWSGLCLVWRVSVCSIQRR
jgi:hypothetical protein